MDNLLVFLLINIQTQKTREFWERISVVGVAQWPHCGMGIVAVIYVQPGDKQPKEFKKPRSRLHCDPRSSQKEDLWQFSLFV
ncbi:hypothetical protein CDAR_575881 [Caerostris darwini]|uniref:Uncharacterized protein n=1 Tax=Caerostris darwini TaxID=1538125 RepID=A0AAV4X781_9ARAC|nr:hypothetical protein CDAR_575881 [Caerostris darwini]